MSTEAIPEYDVVVLYFRAGEPTLARTLHAVLSQSQPARRVVVVDNDSRDGVVPAIALDPRISRLVLPKNLGYAGGMNRGAAALPGGAAFTLFLTHETELRVDAAALLVSAAVESRAAVAGPRMLRRVDGSVWSDGGRVLRSGGVAHLQQSPSERRGTSHEVDWIDGAAMLVANAAIARFGGFDERFFLYWEDVEIGLRLRAAGPVVSVPGAVAVQETGLTPPYFGARNRILLWRVRRSARLVLIAVAGELRRSLAEAAHRPHRVLDAVGRTWGVLDGLTGRLHRRAGMLRSAPASEVGTRRSTTSGGLQEVVSFSLAVPYEGIPHAGGEYYLRHVRALLAAGCRVTIVAPATEPSIAAAAAVDPGVEVVLIPLNAADRRFGVGGRLRKAALVHPYRRRVLRSRSVLQAVRGADLVEFQWTESASLAARLRPIARPGTPFVGVAHDVVTQSLERFAARQEAPFHLRTLRRVRLLLGRRDEPRVLGTLDLVITFSEKDRDKLRAVGVRRDVQVVRPSLEPLDRRWQDPRQPIPGRVLIVAAYNRKENVDGVLWFLDRIWPVVRRARPSAQLHVVGAEPTPDMLSRSDAATGVVVCGYVADLVPEYQEAQVAAVPLRLGAGVKFKTVTAMLWGVPVVSTTIGAEGIGSDGTQQELFVGVADDADDFAAAIVRALDPDDPSARVTAATARAYAAERFGMEAFESTVQRVYRALVDPASG